MEPKKVVQLSLPYKLGDETISEIVLREPTVLELEECQHLEGVKWSRALAAKVAGVPDKLIQSQGVRVLNECTSYLVPFTLAGLPTPSAG